MYRFPQPQEGMARTTMHKIVSAVRYTQQVAASCPTASLFRDLERGEKHGPGHRRTNRPTSPRHMLKLNRLGILGGPVRCQRFTFQRSFALSRFPDRGAPSGGRTRPRPPTQRIRPAQGEHPDSLAQDETKFDTSSSPLWEESQRPPASNPEDGLKRLLQNNTLVVTRSVP
jgi:hypothetical protein